MKKILKILSITMIALAMAACGSEETPKPVSEAPQQEPASATRGSVMAPTATPPARLDLDVLLTPEPTPEPAEPLRETNAAGETPDAENPAGQTTATDPTPDDSGPADGNGLIPQDAETNDQVLLQDIYAQMDLSEFALDPNGPIPYREVVHDRSGRGSVEMEELESIGFKLNFANASENPYLHVFPMLETAQRHWESGGFRGKPSVFLHPNTMIPEPRRYVRFSALDPVTYFIYHPWFEPIQSKFDLHNRKRYTITNEHYAARLTVQPAGGYIGFQEGFSAHWFGRNSTRGVLSKAVEGALEQGQHPNVKPHPLEWYTRRPPNLKERNWDLDDYLRTTIGPPSYSIYRGDNHSLKFDTRNIRELAQTYPNGSVYQTPWTTWKILHPQLPIVQVTSHQETILPLAFGGQDADDLRNTRFSVSFVAAFQHRWTSFQDPNRRIVRFEEHYKPGWRPGWGGSGGTQTQTQKEGNLLRGVQGMINREKHENFPNYWHSSDYMQHSIIGPVIVHVHESEVIEPGIYSVVPSVTSWEAPGPIAPDEHLTMAKNRVERIIPFTYQAGWPNPNWPLPGHVMTNNYSKPGSDNWELAMDAYGDYDW